MQYRVWQRMMFFILAAAVVICGMRAAVQAAEDRPSPDGTPPASGQPASQPATQPASQPSTQPAGATQPAKLIPISFNKAPVAQIADFLAKQLGKPVIVSKEAEKTEVTLVNPKPMALDDAMYILRTALLEQGVAIEERPETIHLVPVGQLISRQIRMLPPDADLGTIKPSNQIVRKIFDVKRYNATKLADVLKPLLPSYGHMVADPATGKLIIVATVEDLLLMARVIEQMDKPDVSGRELRVFHVQNVDVYEIMPWLEKLIASYLGVDAKAISSSGGAGPGRGSGGPSGPGGSSSPMDRGSGDRSSGDRGPGGPGGPSGPGGPGGGASPGATVVTIAADQQRPILLLPDPRRSAIVVEGPANVLAQIELWLKELDQPKPARTDVEIIPVEYGDAEDLASQLTSYLNSNPDESLRSTVRIFAIPGARRLMVRGSEQNRALVKGWLKEFDVDTGTHVTITFTLKYADAQEIADNIKELFSEQKQRTGWYDDYFSSSSRNREPEKTKVTVTANMRKNSVTIKASPERMKRIQDQIKEWDKAFDGEEAAPRIYTLKYADPAKVCELLENLFTKKQKSTSWYDVIFDRDTSTPAPVGRLHGQFTFQAYPDLGKLVVVSKNEENYGVIDDMVEEIDQPQTAGTPRIIQLKYADAEPLAEQLNALLNAPGTPSSIVRRDQTPTFVSNQNGNSPYSMGQNQNNGQQSAQPQQPGRAEQGIMHFWWEHSNRDADLKARQPSNLIGKLRIVPNIEQNLLLVTAPEDYADAVEKLARNLDKPGCQVLIKAVIAEITHEDATSLGYRFSTDPSLFVSGDPLITENALRGLLTYKFEDTFGNHNTITLSTDINNLISLLRRVTDIKIKSEPAIFVADNVEGEFFDGQDIPFISNSQVSDLNVITQSFEYKPVGITLRVRPHITKEGRVALTVTVTASSIVPGRTLFGGAIVDRRETNQRVVLEDGKTFLISGMLRTEDRAIIRRIPGLGDIPGLGELFKHREIAKVNTELLIFLTPYVIGPESTRNVIEKDPLERLRSHNMLPEDMSCIDGPSVSPPGDAAPPASQPCEDAEPSQEKPGNVAPAKGALEVSAAVPVDTAKGAASPKDAKSRRTVHSSRKNGKGSHAS